jgi:hypothetical protein
LQSDGPPVRARSLNTPKCAAVAALALALVIAAVAVAGCGGSSPSAATLLSDTFNAPKPIESGQVDLSFALAASGYAALGQPVALHLSGPFQSTGKGQLPHFALQLSLGTGGRTIQAGATSTAGQFFLELAGTPFAAPASTVKELQAAYAQATKTAGSAKSKSTFASLGLDPGRWLANPVNKGTADVGGEQTAHIQAGLNAQRFLEDAAKLSGASGSVGLAGATPGVGLLSPAGITALSASVKSARVDVYTGQSDHLLRRLSLSVTIATSAKTRAVLQGLRTATLSLQLQFTHLNQSQRIVAPSNPHPLSELLGDLQQLGLLSGSASSAAGGAGSSAG